MPARLPLIVMLLTCAAVSQGGRAASANRDVIPPIRLTPPVVAVEGLAAHQIVLDGEWLFLPQVPAGYRGNVGNAADWKRVTLPGYYALQGHGQSLTQPGQAIAYARQVDVPAEWSGRVVVLRFGSLDGLSRLWVNGIPVGSTDSAFMPVEFDVTDQLKPGGQNTIVVSLEWSLLTHWYEREMGGIGRSITLTALPQTNIARLHADSAVAGDGSTTVTAQVSIDHRTGRPAPLKLHLAVVDAAGRVVVAHTHDFVVADALTNLAIPIAVPGAEPWTHERPRLYTLRAELREEATPLMTAERRFGFRTIRIDGPTLTFNGHPLKLQGANYHLTYEGHGHFPPPELIRRDIERLRDMNLTILRSWPTPYADYLEHCDEIGMFTTVEVPMNLMIYAAGSRKDHGNDPSLETGVRQLAARMLEAYRSHPSILLWGVANECPYYPYFQRTAEWIRREDPARPVFFGSDNRIGIGIPGVQVNDDHYPRDGRTTWDNLGLIVGPGWEIPDDRPIIFSEWCHIHVNNQTELNFDWGIDDHWSYIAEAHRRWADATPQVLAGFIFKSAPYRGVGNTHPWRGLFEDDRRDNAYTWHTFKACAPIRVDRKSISIDRAASTISFRMRNALNFTDLSEVEFHWSRGQETGRVDVRGRPGETVDVRLPVAPTEGAPVTLRSISPRGFVLDEEVFEAPPADAPVPVIGEAIVRETPRHFVIEHGPTVWRLDRSTGQLSAESAQGKPLVTSGPHLVARPSQIQSWRVMNHDIANLARNWNATTVTRLDGHPAYFRAEGSYDAFGGAFDLRFEPDGLTVSYDFTRLQGDQPQDMFMVGVSLDVPSGFDTLDWQREALWSHYPPFHPGRARGVAPALGDGRWRTAAPPTQPAREHDRPWSQEIIGGVTRDFRSTRVHFRKAGLSDSEGARVGADSSGGQHFFACPRDPQDLSGGFTIHVLDHYNGGSELHLRKSLRLSPLELKAGDRVRGTARFLAVPGR